MTESKDKTREAMLDPKPGDEYSEMLSFWVVVVKVEEKGKIVVAHIIPPFDSTKDITDTKKLKFVEYPSKIHFAHYYMYDSIDDFWVTLHARNKPAVDLETEWLSRTYLDKVQYKCS